MDVKDLRKMTVADLDKKLVEKHTELSDSRRSLAAGELKNPRVVRTQRKEIALLKTILAEQRRAEKDNKEKDNA